MEMTTKRGFLLARGWIQAVILVFLFGFFVLGFLAYRTYTGKPSSLLEAFFRFSICAG
jgi:hypothetical protein